MSILVTGGLGYIGGRLAAFLREQTDENIYLTTTRGGKQFPAWTKKFVVLPMNLADTDSIYRCVQQTKPGTIIHLGAMNQTQCQEDSKLAMDVNVEGTRRLLGAAVEHGTKRFVYFSTFQVYGKLSGDIKEETPTLASHPYPHSKRDAEDVVNDYKRSHDLQTLVLRLSNAYGYPMDRNVNVWGLVFNAFCRQIMENGSLVVKANSYRDFIAMQDVVRAVHHFLSVVPAQRWTDGLFNLGGGCCISIVEVAQRVAAVYSKKYGKEPVPVAPPATGQDFQDRPFHYNIDKLKRTGFRWTGDMEEEIAKTLVLCEESQSGRL